MGDLVVGLAKSVVDGVITKTQAVIEEDNKLRQSAQRHLVFITGEFEMMQSFLNVADDERLKNEVVMTWVRQIRELANDVEDCIDFVIHLDMNTSTWWRRLLPSCVAAATLPLHEAVAEIEQLKARVEDVSRRNKRYNLISHSGSKSEPRATASKMQIEARGARKRKLGLENFSQLITNQDNDLEVISVWGTCGDLGMASLLREVYNDPDVCSYVACRAWVKLMHPFNPHEFIQCLMAQFYANSCESQSTIIGVQVLAKMKATQEDLLKEFEQLVITQRYILVLEDLSNMVQWDAIRTFLPDMKLGSRIIVTTQQSEVAILCTDGHPYQVMELKEFSLDHSVYAFYTKSSRRDGGGLSPTAKASIRKTADDWMQKYRPLVGRESEINELCKNVAMERKSTRVISVWGISSIGKSALVRHLYYEKMPSREFNMYSWVDVSYPFKLRDFSRSLLLNTLFVEGEDNTNYITMEIKDPIQECRRLLEDHESLLVIDGLQSTKEWDLIQAALEPRSSKHVIIVITTEVSIATHCCLGNEDLLFHLKGLEANAAVCLFEKEVERKTSSSRFDHIRANLEELILKCGGFPRVIVAIAGLLTTKTVTLMDTVDSLNHRFMHNLETNLEFDSLRGLFGWMHSRLRASPDFLKPCIFYLSIFPQDHDIRRRRLVRRWIAEGYSRDSVERHAEDNAELFFNNLLDLCIIQQPPKLANTAISDKRIVLCQVNGFIREYIFSRQMEENLVCELGASSTLTTQRTGRHLVILSSWNRDKIVFESIDFSRLRSMTVFGRWEPYFVCRSMKQFRVLDLEDASGVTNDHLEQILELLPRLRFLSLRGCCEISRLPGSLGDQRQLQTLDIRHTSIVTLPPAIMKLQKLQYIRAGANVPAEEPRRFSRRRQLGGGVKVPKGIGKVTVLRTLGVVNVSASGGEDFLRELRKLTQLRKLGLCGINMNNGDKFFSAMTAHRHMESLSVRLDKNNQSLLGSLNLPFGNLETLKLYGLEDKLPNWSHRLYNLRKLDLEMGTLTKIDMRSFLDFLPSLCILRLRVKQLQDDVLIFELGTYREVKILEIACSSSSCRLNVTFGSGAMQKLELLKVDCCSGSAYQFSGLSDLSKLKQVLLRGSTDETLKQDLESQLAKHPKRPILKLE